MTLMVVRSRSLVGKEAIAGWRFIAVASRRWMSDTGSTAKVKDELVVLTRSSDGVATLRMNNPSKLNAWTYDMMGTLFDQMNVVAKDPKSKVMILTGTDPYYCAGVNLNSMIKPMHPKTLYKTIVTNNQKVFDTFIEFPKPLIIAANGPAIGAAVTSATLCDAIVASEKATFSTPFSALGISPEGCSSVHFERIMGKVNAERMLGKEGWKPTGAEAKKIGMATEVVQHEKLMETAEKLARDWIATGKKRNLLVENAVDEYKAINARESVSLANSFLSYPFLDAQYRFLSSKGKASQARLFWLLKTFRPLWATLL